MSLIKHACRVIAGQSPSGDDVTDLDGGMPFLQGKAEFGSHSPEPRYECATAPKIAPRGSVLVSVRAPVGAVNMADRAYGIGRGLAAVVPARASAVYVRYLMEARAPYLRSLATGSTFEAIAAADIGGIAVPVEPLSEQQAIADYLDRETAKIDTLIEKQTTMIERLRERRVSVISRATTLGLDEGGPFKNVDSPYLSVVPASWRVSRFGLETRVNSGQVDPTTPPWDSYPLVAPNHIESGTGRMLSYQSAREQGADSGKYLAREGQILYSKIRPTLNKAAIARETCLCSADMYAISVRREGDIRFAAYYMLSRTFHAYASEVSARVKMPKINREELSAAPWLTPPLDEQRAIADYLDRETAKIDTLIAKVERHIELAKERRAALITAAVTGQIDVTNSTQSGDAA